MRLSIKVLLASVLTLIAAMVLFNAIAYASNDNHYYSYTKAIKYCGPDGCMMQDFIVHCLGNRVVDIEPLVDRIYVSRTFERDDPFGWCES
jgi:hypothetical protein